jgi:hypothetical protein
VDDEHAWQGLRAAGMQVAYVETVGVRRCGAVVIGTGDEAVRLIDNVPVDVAEDSLPLQDIA